MRKYKIIKCQDLDKLKQWAQANNMLDGLMGLGLLVADYDGESPVPMLPCNCLARNRATVDDRHWHSSECAGWYEDDPDGVAAYEEYLGRPYTKE